MRAWPLTMEQNLWCGLIAFITLPWGLVLKFVPARWFSWLKLEDTPMTESEEQEGLVASIRRSHTVNKSRTSQRDSKKKIVDDDDFSLNR